MTTVPHVHAPAPPGRTIGAVCAVGILVVGQLYVVLPVLNRIAGD
ncbi:hypothetical protein [Nocardia tengchongensis]